MTAPQIFESTDDGYAYFFRLDEIEDGPEGRIYVGVTRSGGITKGTDTPVRITEENWRREGWRRLREGKHVPGWH
ncbi:hypothetical protein ABZ135_37975 [Streptomyces sp. NPDC006339]|uniref:hypothetical protein n=1 Tax=Streptomyces sp. NPDC006339 TaxID=3156755 RepID=UPI0033ADA7CD